MMRGSAQMPRRARCVIRCNPIHMQAEIESIVPGRWVRWHFGKPASPMRQGARRQRRANASKPVDRGKCCRRFASDKCRMSTEPLPTETLPRTLDPPPGAETPRQEEMPLAVVHGQPVLQIPQDLYIPPDALEVILEAFEGPLDLLLYLIRRQNLDILDIPVAEITRQYMDYIDVMHEMRLELAAEYLVMAAILAEIKSRLLLPRPPVEEGVEEDPRAELVRRLQEYERFKKAAEDIDALPRMNPTLATAKALVPNAKTVGFPQPVTLRERLLPLREWLGRAKRSGNKKAEAEPLWLPQGMAKCCA